jgi:hypothetical protein
MNKIIVNHILKSQWWQQLNYRRNIKGRRQKKNVFYQLDITQFDRRLCIYRWRVFVPLGLVKSTNYEIEMSERLENYFNWSDSIKLVRHGQTKLSEYTEFSQMARLVWHGCAKQLRNMKISNFRSYASEVWFVQIKYVSYSPWWALDNGGIKLAEILQNLDWCD